MADSRRHYTIIGCVGVLCLAVFWAAAFFPRVANVLPDSSFGKIVVLGIWVASAPLTIVAAMRGSKWWWVAVAASAITLWEVYFRLWRVVA